MFQLTIGEKTPDPVYLGQEIAWIITILVQLAWPIVAIVAILVLKAPITRFIDRIIHVDGPGGLGADTENKLRAAEAATGTSADDNRPDDGRPDETIIDDQRPKPDRPDGNGEANAVPTDISSGQEARQAFLSFMAGGFSAIDIIVRSWSLLELEIIQCGYRYNLSHKNPYQMANVLYNHSIISSSQFKALSALRSVRNTAVHDPFNVEISLDQAQRFAKSTAELASQIAEIGSSPTSGKTATEPTPGTT